METDKIVILGTGYTGKELTRLGRNSGYSIVGTTRSDDTARFLDSQGATAVDWSVDEPLDDIANHLDPSTTVVYSIPTLFRDYQASDDAGPARHTQPVAEVLEVCRRRNIERFIYLSSTSVYGDHGGSWVDETSPREPTSPVGKMRSDIEDYLLDQSIDFPVNIARLVGIYGPGRTLVNYIQSGRYTLLSDAKQISNRVHVHDIARAIIAIIERGSQQTRVFNVTDGRPQPTRDLVEFICNQAGIDLPPEETIDDYIERVDNPNAVARRQNTIRVLNDRLREELNFSLVYPDAFSGYEDILETPQPTSPEPS